MDITDISSPKIDFNIRNFEFPIIKGYRATEIQRAFILNALATALIAAVTVEAKALLDGLELFRGSEFVTGLISFFIGFVAALIIFWGLYGVFGFGGGMISPDEPVKATGIIF